MPFEVILTAQPEELATDCDALVLVTDWQEFRTLDYQQLARLMKAPVIIDGRNFLDPEILSAAGFYYIAIGRTALRNQVPEKSGQQTQLRQSTQISAQVA